ncbi:DNA-binding protein [Citrobacter koseri]|nr:BRO family protein [Citrobacter koseri]MBJ9353584.1 DNA-binding protein [Citrobacter koseri]
MKNQLMTFSSEDLNFSMSGILYKDKPAFDAVELAKSLGYADPHQALKNHCKSLIKLDSVKSTELGFGFRPKGITLAGQADLFRLILRSNLPSAERIQDWVCEDVLPSIMETGSYNKHQSVVEAKQPEISPHPDMASLARVVAEATAFAMVKVIMEAGGHQDSAPLSDAKIIETKAGFVNDDAEFVPVHKVSWETGLSDPSCRRLVQFANLPSRQLPGVRGLCVHRESFLHAFQVLLEESTRPSGKRKRWQHPEFGGFILRKDPKEIPGESD